MRHTMAIGIIAVFGVLAGAGFMMSRRATAAVAEGVLVGQIKRLVPGWEARPGTPRKVTIVVGDARLDDFIGKLSSKEKDVFAYAEDTGGVGDWFKRKFTRRSMAAPAHTPFVKTFAAQPETAAWTYSEAEADAEEAARELMKAILTAAELDAEIDFIAHGAPAAAALKAIDQLKEAVYAGRPVSVRRLITL
ncbi:MAG: hypothetical protein FD187_3224 [bacterium]|nr:MAG: hypothetical protein FD187_3224 [bacterium]